MPRKLQNILSMSVFEKHPRQVMLKRNKGVSLAVGTVTEKPAWQMKMPNLDLKSRFKTIICPNHESGDCGKWKAFVTGSHE